MRFVKRRSSKEVGIHVWKVQREGWLGDTGSFTAVSRAALCVIPSEMKTAVLPALQFSFKPAVACRFPSLEKNVCAEADLLCFCHCAV